MIFKFLEQSLKVLKVDLSTNNLDLASKSCFKSTFKVATSFEEWIWFSEITFAISECQI